MLFRKTFVWVTVPDFREGQVEKLGPKEEKVQFSGLLKGIPPKCLNKA